MAVKIVDAGGTLRTAQTMYVRDGSTLRRILRKKVMDGATLRTVATFATPLDASISSTVTYTPIPHTANQIIRYAATASPGGGLGPYTYSWALISGSGWSFSDAASATTQIIGNSGSATDGVARVTVTDSAGQTDTAELALTA